MIDLSQSNDIDLKFETPAQLIENSKSLVPFISEDEKSIL